MSIVLLIDGYNVIAPVAAPGRGAPPNWLATERMRLLDRLVEHLDETVRLRTCVVFDAKDAPHDRPNRFDHHGIDVRFAVDHPEADDLLEEIIAAHTTPRHLSVVSSDHRVRAAAKRKRAGMFDSDPWLDRLLDGYLDLLWYPKRKPAKEKMPQDLANEPPPSRDPSLPIPIRGTPCRDEIDAAIDTMLSDDDLNDLLGDHP